MMFNRNNNNTKSYDVQMGNSSYDTSSNKKTKKLLVLLPSILAVALVSLLSILILYTNLNGGYKTTTFSNNQFSLGVPESEKFTKNDQGESSVIWISSDNDRKSLISVIIHPAEIIKIEDVKNTSSESALKESYLKRGQEVRNYSQSSGISGDNEVLTYYYEIYENDQLKNTTWTKLVFSDARVGVLVIESENDSKISDVAIKIRDSFELKPVSLELVE